MDAYEAMAQVFRQLRDAKGVFYAVEILQQRRYSLEEVVQLLQAEGYQPSAVNSGILKQVTFLNEKRRQGFMAISAIKDSELRGKERMQAIAEATRALAAIEEPNHIITWDNQLKSWLQKKGWVE